MTIYSKSLNDDFASNKFCRFYANKKVIQPLIEQGISIAEVSELVRESKDAGALKVPHYFLKKYKNYYADLLIKTGLLFTVLEEVGEFVFPRKISHLVNDKDTSTLLWHRDSYRHLSNNVGPIPSPLKLAIYLTPVDKHSGVTGLSRHFIDHDFNNRYIDQSVAFLLSKFAFLPRLGAGDALLFDGRLMHCRKRQIQGPYRNVVIFSLSRDLTLLPKNEEIDDAYYGLLKESISTSENYEHRFNALTEALNQ